MNEITIGIKNGVHYVIENQNNIVVKILYYDCQGMFEDDLQMDENKELYFYDEIQ